MWRPGRSVEVAVSYRQVALLRMALVERDRAGAVTCSQADHWHGRTMLDGEPAGLIYPDSFFTASAKLIDTPKTIRTYFVGSVGRARRKMLEPFRDDPSAVIEESSRGRSGHKNRWDPQYYEALAQAQFGLCPHHTDWPGPWEHLWTYRFIDCTLVGAIPVVFRATPLAGWLVDGFRWHWDDRIPHSYSRDDAMHNRALAEERFRLGH